MLPIEDFLLVIQVDSVCFVNYAAEKGLSIGVFKFINDFWQC